MKALMTYSYRDSNFANYLTNEIMNSAKIRFSKKYFRKVVYETLEEELKQILKKKIISCEIGLKVCTDTILYLTVNIAYNRIKLEAHYSLGGKNLEVGVVVSRRLFSDYIALTSCFDDKFFRFSAKTIKTMLEKEFPEFKFPSYEKYYYTYTSAGYGVISYKEDLDGTKEIYMKNLLQFENVLYFMTHSLFLFVTKDENIFFMAESCDIENKLWFTIWNRDTICSKETLIEFFKTVIRIDENFIRENLNNPELILKLRKSAILVDL